MARGLVEWNRLGQTLRAAEARGGAHSRHRLETGGPFRARAQCSCGWECRRWGYERVVRQLARHLNATAG